MHRMRMECTPALPLIPGVLGSASHTRFRKQTTTNFRRPVLGSASHTSFRKQTATNFRRPDNSRRPDSQEEARLAASPHHCAQIQVRARNRWTSPIVTEMCSQAITPLQMRVRRIVLHQIEQSIPDVLRQPRFSNITINIIGHRGSLATRHPLTV